MYTGITDHNIDDIFEYIQCIYINTHTHRHTNRHTVIESTKNYTEKKGNIQLTPKRYTHHGLIFKT